MANSGIKFQSTTLNRADVETIFQLMIVDICSLLAHRRSMMQSIEAMKLHLGLPVNSVQYPNMPKLNFEYENFENRTNSGTSDSDFAAIKVQYDEKMSLVKGRKHKTSGCDSVPAYCFTKEATVDTTTRGSYEFSPELQFVARSRALHYAGLDMLNLRLAHKSAIIIQRAYRNHRLKKYFERCFIHRRKQSLQSACSRPINFDQQLSLNRIPPPVPIRKHCEKRNQLSERTPDWSQTFTPDCNNKDVSLISDNFTPPRSGGGVLFARRNQSVTPDERKKSYPPILGTTPEAGFSNSNYFHPSTSVLLDSHFPFPVNSGLANIGNNSLKAAAANLVKIEGLQQSVMCNRSSSNSEHASTGSDEGIESAPASANSFNNYDNYDQEEYSSPLPLSAATVISEAVPPSMLSSAVVASASSQSRPAHASSSTVASNSSSSSSPSMLSNTNNIHTYSTTQSTNCLAPSLPPIADYENSRGLGGSYDGTSPSTLVRTLQQPPKHFNGSESLLHQGNSTHASQKARHFGGAAKSMKDYLNENLVQLYNCKRTGVRYTPQQEKTIRIGMFLFNKDPKKGLKFLTEKKFLEPDSPADVAYMLACYKRGLNKAQVGEYLASEKPFNSKVLKQFVELNRPRFENKPIDEALRVFMTLFRLPGEGQKIDRILMSFGHVYASVNQPVALMLSGAWSGCDYTFEERLIRGASAAHILSYAIMMLNTDLHNSSVKGSMSMKDFKRNCRGSEELKHLDDNFLEGVYRRIKANQFREPEDHSTAIALFSSNLQNFKNILLDEPFRCLVAVCPFHIAMDGKNTKNLQEVYLFLFNDMLLAATREQNKKKLSKSQLPVNLATVLLQTFTYRFDIPLLHLSVDAFDLTARPGVFAGTHDFTNAFSWCLSVSQNGLFSCSTNGGTGRLVYNFFCSNYDDFFKFSNDLKIYVKDMTIIEQLRIHDNLEYMRDRPLDELERRQNELNGSYDGRGSDSSVSNGVIAGDLRNSRIRSNSVDSLLDPATNSSNNPDGALNTADVQRMLIPSQ